MRYQRKHTVGLCRMDLTSAPPCRRTLTGAGLCGSMPEITITEGCRVRKSDVVLLKSACHIPRSGGREQSVAKHRSRMTKR